MIDKIIDGILKHKQSHLDVPRLQVNVDTWNDIISSVDWGMKDMVNKPFLTIPAAYFMGCPVIISAGVPDGKIALVNSKCDYCGENIGLLNRCPKCGGSKNSWDAEEIIVLENLK